MNTYFDKNSILRTSRVATVAVSYVMITFLVCSYQISWKYGRCFKIYGYRNLPKKNVQKLNEKRDYPVCLILLPVSVYPVLTHVRSGFVQVRTNG